MAEVVTKFKLETSQFDSKLRDAASGLSKFANEAQIAGKSFDGFSKESVDAAKALGTISTSATSAKGKVSELVGAFNAAARAYNDLTKEEQQSEWGKALSSSLETLKGRISEAKSELYGLNNTSRDAGGVMGMLKEKLSINIDAIKLFNIGLKAAEGALSVAKDAFFASETNVDDWGRTVEAAGSLYQSFLQTLNTGDFSGFIQRINDVIGKAKEAYNAMDTLGTVMTIANPERAKLQARATELKATIRRAGAGSAEGKAAQQQLLALEPQLQQSYKVESKLNYNAFVSEVDKKLAEAGIKLGKTSRDFLLKTFSSTEAYEALKANAAGEASKRVSVETPWGRGVRQTEDTRNVNQKLLDLFDDEWRRKYSPYLSASYSARGAAASTMLGDARYIRPAAGGGGGGGTGGGAGGEEKMLVGGIANLGAMNMEVEGTTQSMRDLQAALQYFQNMLATATTTEQYNTAQAGIAATKATIAVQPDALKYGLSTDMMADIENTMNTAIEDMQKRLKPVEIKMSASKSLVADGEKLVSAYTAAANAVSSVGSALQGIEDPGAKVAGIIAQAIANIALSFAGSLKGTFTPWDWIAAAVAGTATMVSTIAAIKSATAGSYEEGGIVPGNSYHGDHLLAAVNSQELILSKAQSDNIASLLVAGENGSGGGGSSRPYVSGEQIYLGMTNYLKRSGRGEIVTTR